MKQMYVASFDSFPFILLVEWYFYHIAYTILVLKFAATTSFKKDKGKYKNVNPLSTNPTTWSNTLKQFVSTADELFESVWPFCGVGA